ncbi:MAG: hypothetical protein NC401_18660 [Ruminococcus sp.]|nr:hypothetical protein [Ruminococcus sp.]
MMKKHGFAAALTAAAVAVSSVSAFPLTASARNAATTCTLTPEFSKTVEMNAEDFTSTESFIIDARDFADAVKEEVGDDLIEDSVRISKATVTYTLEGEGDDMGVWVIGNGWDSDGNFINFFNDPDAQSAWYGAKSGTITTTDSEFKNSDMGDMVTYPFLEFGASGKGEGDLTLNITGAEVELTYTVSETVTGSGTETYTFSESWLPDLVENELGGNPITVGHTEFGDDATGVGTFCMGDWKVDDPALLDGITTIQEFLAKYGSLEFKFNASDIKGDLEVFALFELVKDEDKGEYQRVFLPAQTVAAGNNVYSVDLSGKIKAAYNDIKSVSVHIRAKEEGKTASFALDTYEYPPLPVTGTAAYTSLNERIRENVNARPGFTVGYAHGDDLEISDWSGQSGLEGIYTVEDFLARYGSIEFGFTAVGLTGEAEIFASVEVTDRLDNWQQIWLPAQDVVEGKNLYTVDLTDKIKTNYDYINSVCVHIRAKNSGETAYFRMGDYGATVISATGMGAVDVPFDFDDEGDPVVELAVPDWWDPEWGDAPLNGTVGLWYWDNEPGNRGANFIPTITELYGSYDSINVSFNASGAASGITYHVSLQTRDGDNYGEDLAITDEIKLVEGLNSVKIDLPALPCTYTDIWGIGITFTGEKEASFTVSKPGSSSGGSGSGSSGGSGSSSTTSAPSASEPSTSNTETFKTDEKPIEDIMEEVKPDTTAVIEVAPEDTTIKADVFEAAKEKNITLELTLDNGVKWEIKASTVSGAVDVNINVELNTSNVPASSVEAVAGSRTTMQISLAHDGGFGFEANISIPVATANNGKVANLFHFNNGALEFVASATVSAGMATLPFSHASEYVIVFDERSMGAADNGSDTAPANPNTGASGVGVGALLAVSAIAAVVVCGKNKRK